MNIISGPRPIIRLIAHPPETSVPLNGITQQKRLWIRIHVFQSRVPVVKVLQWETWLIGCPKRCDWFHPELAYVCVSRWCNEFTTDILFAFLLCVAENTRFHGRTDAYTCGCGVFASVNKPHKRILHHAKQRISSRLWQKKSPGWL